MNKKIEDLYRTIATGIYAVRPTQKWAKATLKFKSIALMNESACSCVLEDAITVSLKSGFDVDDALAELRTEMARLHENGNAWYSAECDVDANGKYAFRFDYDRLPSFSIIPSPSKWIDEFSKYPRPQLKASIQDWIDGKVEAEQAPEGTAVELTCDVLLSSRHRESDIAVRRPHSGFKAGVGTFVGIFFL